MDTKLRLLFFCFFLGHTHVSCDQKCHGNPPMYNGKNCASTMRYARYQKGACGCGPDKNNNQVYFTPESSKPIKSPHSYHHLWSSSGLTVAINQLFFDVNNKIWCGKHCGRCVRLTTTCGYVDKYGGPTPEGQSKVFMVTNLCPLDILNRAWCGQTRSHQANNFGYGWHFELENGVGQIDGMGWNNPEVTWEWADCDQGHREESRTPSRENYKQCFCGKQ